MTKGQRAGNSAIAVVRAANQKISHFVMALIKELNLTQSFIKLKKLKKSFFVHANKQIINLFVMDHIIKSNIEIIN